MCVPDYIIEEMYQRVLAQKTIGMGDGEEDDTDNHQDRHVLTKTVVALEEAK